MNVSKVAAWAVIVLCILFLIGVIEIILGVAFGIIGLVFSLIGSLVALLFSKGGVTLIAVGLLAYVIVNRNSDKPRRYYY